MKKNILYIGCLTILSACAINKPGLPVTTVDCTNIDQGYSRSQSIGHTLDDLVRDGVPGCVLAIHSNDGWWTAARGLARIEDKTPMQSCHLQYLQSISKTYLAVAVLKLYEQGKIHLDSPMTQYLPEKYCRYVTDAGKISVRMLLSHTSGVPEYNFAPSYVSYLLQHPSYFFSAEEYLKYIKGKPLDFAPGSNYSYRNTNYVLLALMTDALTGDHARFISETVFAPLGLTHTFYRSEKDYLTYPLIVNTYWDRHSDGIVENVSLLQRTNVASMIGDDGIVTTPEEAVKFLKGLVEGKLLSIATLDEMRTWVHDKKGNPRYGLGLGYTTHAGEVGYGHSGGGIGAGCELYYFPKKNVYMFIGINLGTVTDSPLHEAINVARDKLYEEMLR